MGKKSGESQGERVRGELLIEWIEDRNSYAATMRWSVVDARGQRIELLDQSHTSMLGDDEWLERSLTRLARTVAQETRLHHEERRDGVTRLFSAAD